MTKPMHGGASESSRSKDLPTWQRAEDPSKKLLRNPFQPAILPLGMQATKLHPALHPLSRWIRASKAAPFPS